MKWKDNGIHIHVSTTTICTLHIESLTKWISLLLLISTKWWMTSQTAHHCALLPGYAHTRLCAVSRLLLLRALMLLRRPRSHHVIASDLGAARSRCPSCCSSPARRCIAMHTRVSHRTCDRTASAAATRSCGRYS